VTTSKTTAQTTATKTITVHRINRFGAVHQVTWKDGGFWKRRVMVDIAEWSKADEIVANAVAATYPADARPTVIVPLNVWR
jgi:hypothetical protein